MIVKLLAPAKINLGLEILGKRNDGYHEVDMVMQTINLFDEVSIQSSSETDIKVTINKEIGCTSRENIAYKAAERFFEYVGIKNKGVNISINKNIPVCAGLAGGSSDGAAVIVGLNEMFDTRLSQGELMEIGARVGADVPFCILGGTARAGGIGTDLKSLNSLKGFYIVLVKPSISISTKAAYDMVDKSKLFFSKRTENLVEAIENNDIVQMFKRVFNCFDEVNGIDGIRNIKESLINNKAKAVCMSGSGPSVFGLYLDESKVVSCFDTLLIVYKNVFLCEPIDCGVKVQQKR